MGLVQVVQDGVLDYPLYAGQPLTGVWSATTGLYGVLVEAHDGYLHFYGDASPSGNEAALVSIVTPLATAGGIHQFRIRVNEMVGDVRITFIQDVLLQFMDGGGTARWGYEASGFHKLAESTITANGEWVTITMVLSPTTLTLFEDGVKLFEWTTAGGSQAQPQFNVEMLLNGADLSVDIGEILSVPPVFAAGVDTPWDFSFRSGVAPAPEALTFLTPTDGIGLQFHQGFVRFATESLAGGRSTSSLRAASNGPPAVVFCFQLRVNTCGGSETRVTLPGNNVLRLTEQGARAEWVNGTTGTRSGIVAGTPGFTLVTLVFSEATVAVFEDGSLKYEQEYPTRAYLWTPSVAVEHAGAGTAVSVDVGGIRTLPSIKSPQLLAIDLQEELLAYYPLKRSLGDVTGMNRDLVPVGGSITWVTGKYGDAAGFSGTAALKIPPLGVGAAASWTISFWALVNAYPEAGALTGLAGSVLLDGDGNIVVKFIYSATRVCEVVTFVSRRPLSTGAWHNVVVTYSYDEARLVLYVDGALDSIHYADRSQFTRSALIPSASFVGGNKRSASAAMVVLDGAIGDLMFFTQHLHAPSVSMLTGNTGVDGNEDLAFLLIPAFILVAAVVVQVGVEIAMLQQSNTKDSYPSVEEVARRIVAIVGEPARTGTDDRVSRADLGLTDSYPIFLDVGGEGRFTIGGVRSGFTDAINLNDVYTLTTANGLDEEGTPIPNLVLLQPWATNPPYPFVDNFADRIAMIGAPLEQGSNVDEIKRVIKPGGAIDLWVTNTDAVLRLARKFNPSASLEELKSAQLPEFEINGRDWFQHYRIIAKK